MIFHGRIGGREVALSVKSHSVSLSDEGRVATWDHGARLHSVWKDQHTFLRMISGAVLHKWHEADASAPGPAEARRRVSLQGAGVGALVDEAAALAVDAAGAMRAASGAWVADDGQNPETSIVDLIERCGQFDAARAEDDARWFTRVYAPIGLLPPDQYLATVVQATVGSPFDPCTSTDPAHRVHRERTPEEFARHLDEVREFFGASIGLRERSVFLGGAGALGLPSVRLAELLPLVRERFGPRPIDAFANGAGGRLKTAAEYAVLRTMGLRKVYVGLESGHDALLALARGSATSREAVETALTVRAAGLAVGVVVLIGLGGARLGEVHVADTVKALNAMRLGAADLIYFGELVESPGTPYAALVDTHGLRPLDAEARLTEMAAIRQGLRFAGKPPLVARYDIREFTY